MKTQIVSRNCLSALLAGHWPCVIRMLRIAEGLARRDSAWSANLMLAIGAPEHQTVSIMM
jgi:hypothetical protein